MSEFKPTNSGSSRRAPVRVIVIASLALAALIIISFSVYYTLQSSAEQAIRNAIFEQQEQREIQYARSLAQNVQSDLEALMSRLHSVAASKTIQEGDFSSEKADRALQSLYEEAKRITETEGVYILDSNNIVANYYHPTIGPESYIGYDTSNLTTVVEYRDNLPNPTYSKAYKSVVDGQLQVALYYPIHNEDTGAHMGAVSLSTDVVPFFRQYGNIDELSGQYLAALDRNATILVTPFKDFIGLSVYDEYVRNFTSQEIYDHYEVTMGGKESPQVFLFRTGERLNIGEPIILNGKPTYSLFVVTPTASIYSQVDALLANDRLETYVLLAAIASSIGIALFFILRWGSTMETAVRERTSQLEEANKSLAAHDKMQKEFINIAAHELRTPVQPLLGMAELLDGKLAGEFGQISKEEIAIISRNAKRLERLTTDILQVSRIESNTLTLNKENVDLEQKIKNVVADVRTYIRKDQQVQIIIEPANGTIHVEADKSKLFEVLSNLIRNSIKFTEKGAIKISLEKQNGYAVIKIRDTGSGIDPGIMPRLFEKFATASESQGTGLGLFISKAIVQAHGGKIWAENNVNGVGAAFNFTLPLATTSQIDNRQDPAA